MPHKYQSYIDSLSDCPPSSCQSKNIEAFRIVFDDINDRRNFLPPLMRQPARRNTFNTDSKICSGYALSFFSSLEGAKKKYQALMESIKNINKTLGTHIAVGTILETDGVVTKINASGHFDLHELASCSLIGRFEVVEKVYSGTD